MQEKFSVENSYIPSVKQNKYIPCFAVFSYGSTFCDAKHLIKDGVFSLCVV